MFICLIVSLLFCTSLQMYCADNKQMLPINVPHYVLQSKWGNFSDIFVSKKAFDTILRNKKNQILGFLDHSFKNINVEIGVIEFVLESCSDANRDDKAQRIIIDITHITYGGGSRHPYFQTYNEALMYLDEKSSNDV